MNAQVKTAAEIEAAVSAFLLEAKITFTTSGGERITREPETRDGKPWECFAWRVLFQRQTPPAHFMSDFYCGLAHKKQGWSPEGYRRDVGKPPSAADVLYSLISDANCGDSSFADFCADLGYDEDSRRAERTYFACQDCGRKLRTVFSRAQLATLGELVQDL